MRRRLLVALIAVAAGTVIVLGVPLAILGRVAVRDDAEEQADRQADAIGFAVVSRLADGGTVDAALLAPFATGGRSITVTDRQGRVTSAGPPPGGNSIVTDIDLGDGASVELRTSDDETERRQLVVVGVVAGLAAIAMAGAAVVAVVVARRLNRPLDELAATARRLGDGDFTARASMSGLVDVDAAASTLNQGAGRIEQMVNRERQFASNASHQLRTPLTALRLRLEEMTDIGDDDVRTEAEAAIAQADRLDATISELLRLAREGAAGPTTGPTSPPSCGPSRPDGARRPWAPAATSQSAPPRPPGRSPVLPAPHMPSMCSSTTPCTTAPALSSSTSNTTAARSRSTSPTRVLESRATRSGPCFSEASPTTARASACRSPPTLSPPMADASPS